MDKTKILLLPLHRWVSSSWGGELVWAFNLADSLGRCPELDVTALVGNIDTEDRQRLESRIRIESIGLRRLDTKGWTSKINHARFYFELARRGMKLVRDFRPDVIHHMFPMGLGSGLNPQFLLSRHGPPKVIGPLLYPPVDRALPPEVLSPAGLPDLGHAMRIFSPILRSGHKATLRCASWLLYDSPDTRDLAIRLMPSLANTPWSVLAPGSYDPITTVYNPQSSGLTLGVMHYLRRKKRLHLLLQAVAQSKRNISIVIGGRGPEESNLKRLSMELGLETKVKFVGNVSPERRLEFWKSVDLAVSLDMGPPLAIASIQEAMIAGRPFIASGLGSSYYELPFGIIIGRDVARNLGLALERLCLDQNRLLGMASAAGDFALRNFTSESVRKNLLDIYRAVIEDQPLAKSALRLGFSPSGAGMANPLMNPNPLEKG